MIYKYQYSVLQLVYGASELDGKWVNNTVKKKLDKMIYLLNIEVLITSFESLKNYFQVT